MNGRDSIKIRYEKYDWHYCKLNNEKHPVQEKANHGVKVYVALQSHHVHYLDIKVKKFCWRGVFAEEGLVLVFLLI